MAKPTIKHNPKTAQVLDDLGRYLEFCKDFGFRFNEGDLYNFKAYAYQQFSKYQQGKTAKNMWVEDSRKFGETNRMSGMREKDSADYDLERFVELFDEALTSNDPRVKNALRQLMMMVILTSNEHEDRVQSLSHREGPLRRMQEDVRDMATRMHMLDEQIKRMEHTIRDFINRPPSGYTGGMGGDPKWPTAYDSTTYGQAISGPSINTTAISAHEFWKNEKVAKYQALISKNVLQDLNINVASTPKGLHKE